MNNKKTTPTNFIHNIVKNDLVNNKCERRVTTRFPPEPNGYLHIGHAKSICLNFGVAAEFGGYCHLRFDDTNPIKEEQKYINSIIADINWLGFDWKSNLFYTSDYFQLLYDYAIFLIKKGKAYVDDQTTEEIRLTRGTLTKPGINSPFRNRSVEENLNLFIDMNSGESADGSRVLRAKIDMTHPNLHMRDPTIFRIRNVHHHRTKNKWCIYPMYDYSHCISDSIEGITHSLCTLEFEDNRILYDWFLNELELYHPQQIEFAHLNLEYTVLSKRKLLILVKKGFVNGWDDPRIPTLSGLKRRGFTAKSIRTFCNHIGIGKKESWISINILNKVIRDDLNTKVPRVMGVLNPLKIIIDNYPKNQIEELSAPYFPDNPSRMGNRKVPFSRELYIEQDDFQEKPSKNFWRLAPGREVRLRWGYFITCLGVVKDNNDKIIEVHCSYDPATKGGKSPDNRKPKSTIHWVSAFKAFIAEVRLYNHLFLIPQVDNETDDFCIFLNPDSLKIIPYAALEPSLNKAKPGSRYQFERNGYFFIDPKISTQQKLIFNRIVTLHDHQTIKY